MKLVKLKDVCEFINGDRGKNYPKSNEFVDSGIPFINAGHIKESRIDFSKMNYISEEVFEKLGSGKIQTGDVLFCLRGSLGKNAIINFDKGAIASSLVILRNKNKSTLNTAYLMFVLNSQIIFSQIYRANNGSSQPNLSAKSVKEFVIPLPDIEYQKKVVKVLDLAQGSINKRKQQIEELEQLAKSMFLKLFGDPIVTKWNLIKLQEITDVRDGTHDSPKYVEEGFPLVTSKNIKDGNIDLENVSYISEEDYININKRSKVEINDIIMPMIGTIGNPVIVKNEPEFAIKNVALIKFNSDSPINNIYLKYLLNSHYLENVLARNRRGGTQKFLSLKDIRNMMIPVPPLELQRKFVEIIDEINRNKDILNNSLNEKNDYFNSIMQRVFNGELFRD
ncbi:restriction endonuclease subunit S [Virgibacillus pantothenticus]|uniref:restriction endonuclease subunit S n=1 Tax=Virgibacillus pantothenticus TaxID=1473 RepID=UPI003D2DEE93